MYVKIVFFVCCIWFFVQVYGIGEGDYGVVVGVELQLWVEYFIMLFGCCCIEGCVQLCIGVDVVSDDQMFQVGLFQGCYVFGYQYVYDGIDEIVCDVGFVLFVDIGVVLFDYGQYCCF